MTATVICKNPDCNYWSRERTVRLQHLGQGVYISTANLACHCGHTLVTVKVEK